jgi:Prophage minor tail protein Z (GPZ)
LGPTMIDVRSNIAEVLASMERYSRDVVDKAIPRAINRTAEMARTEASRRMRDDGYNYTAAEIKQAMSLFRANPGRLVASIKVKRKVKSLMLFNPRESKAGVTVKVHGAKKLIKGAFIGQLRNGSQGVYVEDKAAGKTVVRHSKQYKRGGRGGWHDFPIRKLYGPSVGGAYSTDRIQEIMEKMIRETFADRLAHELQYLSR